MTLLFAAPDASGALRFIGEVERGAVCGCSCPVCGSALVARQGAANEWHFAHEASQERPECETAADRMLRRLMVEHVQTRGEAGGLSLPPYQQRVAIVRALINVHEDVQWGAQAMGGLQWRAEAAPDEPVAQARLDTGADLHLFVMVGEGQLPPPQTGCAQLVFRCRLPPGSVLRDRQAAEQYLAQHGELAWAHHPDTLGLVAAAQARLEARSRQIYANWLAMADAAGGPATVVDARPPPLFYGPSTRPDPRQAPRYACAPAHAPNVSFTLYRLSPTEAWLLYLLERVGPLDWRTATEKFYALAPYPGPFDGWAQALPPSVGVADLDVGVVRCTGFLDAVTYLSRRAHSTRSGRNPLAFEAV
ncbi:MAG: hypothetical protein KIT86_04155 [Hydrogenophaga sp.]|uniref:hypothetical protein n=1 Tax=Hydrogenophaga sp. TaxID=1904254 RepID=UPI00260BA4DF|nr:hypothetical protein [Hydrogenophaga sp.]MCW5668831.1 hypothetical protein [Hydrogenophaga sp.]